MGIGKRHVGGRRDRHGDKRFVRRAYKDCRKRDRKHDVGLSIPVALKRLHSVLEPIMHLQELAEKISDREKDAEKDKRDKPDDGKDKEGDHTDKKKDKEIDKEIDKEKDKEKDKDKDKDGTDHVDDLVLGQMHAAGELVAPENSCVSVSYEPGLITVDYGTGCNIGENFFAGSYTLAWSLQDGILSVGVEYVSFTVNFVTRDGLVSMSIQPGMFDLGIDLSIKELIGGGGTSESAIKASLNIEVVTDRTVLVNGNLVFTDENGTFEMHAIDLEYSRLCYLPSGGSLELIISNQPNLTIFFLPSTPVTGEVLIQVGTGLFVPYTLSSCR